MNGVAAFSGRTIEGMRTLNGDTIMLIGSTGGIARAILEELSNENVQFALGSTHPETLEEQTEAERSRGRKVFARHLDATNEGAVASFMKDAAAELGGIDALINLAGMSIPGKVQDLDLDSFEKMLDLNVKTTFLASKHYLRTVDADRGGRIINVSSVASKRANGAAPLYCTSKAAVTMLSKATQINAMEKNVQVNNVCPAAVDSPFWGDRQVPRETFLTTQDVAEVIHFILTRNSYVVIQDIEFESFHRMS